MGQKPMGSKTKVVRGPHLQTLQLYVLDLLLSGKSTDSVEFAPPVSVSNVANVQPKLSCLITHVKIVIINTIQKLYRIFLATILIF